MKTIIKSQFCTSIAFLILTMGCGLIAFAESGGPDAIDASMNADGSRFTVTAPDALAFLADFSATIQIDGKSRVLSSLAGITVSRTNSYQESTPFGPAEITETSFFFENEKIDLLFRLGRVKGVPGVMAQAGIRNIGEDQVILLSITPASLAGQLAGNPSEWLITSLTGDSFMATNQQPPVAISDIHEQLQLHEYGGLYRRNGTGLFFGPIGTPTAYVNASLTHRRDGKILMDIQTDMSGVHVDAGKTRWGQQVVLLMEPPGAALARWAEWVGKTHGARISKGALSGWNDSNFLKKKDVSKELLDVVHAIRTSGRRLRPEVIQIEDLDGLALDSPSLLACTQRIGETGARFGIRLAFEGKTGPTGPVSRADITTITQTVHRAVQRGFNYLKIRLPPAGDVPEGGKRTAFEIYRDEWAAVRKAAGDDAYILFSHKAPDRAAVGSVDASRTGADAGRYDLRSSIQDVLRSYQLNGRWFAIDNDSYYLGAQIANMREMSGGSPMARTWMSMVGLSCGAAITSDPWYRDNAKPYWHNIEVMTPPAKERTEVIDLCTGLQWPRLVGHVTRSWGDWSVALLWNPGITETSVKLDFAEAGLNPKHNYAVWSFWDNRYLGVASGSWTTPPLPPSGSQHLRFTDLDKEPNRPVVIGSSLHIYCGAAEIKRVTSLTDAIEIELTDAGAREGDLFIYSRQQPVPMEVSGCAVKHVSRAGENVWQISLAARQSGVPQLVELGITLPLMSQEWFWLLVAAAGTGLILAAWRYLASLRIQRERALSEERTRIARDLHDDLGGELSSIAMLSDLTQHHAGGNEIVLARLRDISTHSRDTVRRLEEIVWAINPANDNIERFADYFCKVAQAYLELAGVRSRFDLPDQFPHRPLTSMQRHNLFLAAKEAMHNSVRHGKPDEVTIRINLTGEHLVVTIEDNGTGFTDTPSLPAGHGSANMQARMKNIGGTFDRHTAPGKGTVVVLTAPLRET